MTSTISSSALDNNKNNLNDIVIKSISKIDELTQIIDCAVTHPAIYNNDYNNKINFEDTSATGNNLTNFSNSSIFPHIRRDDLLEQFRTLKLRSNSIDRQNLSFPETFNLFLTDLLTLYSILYDLYTVIPFSDPFRELVDAIALKVYNYYNVIKEPMSIHIILDKIAATVVFYDNLKKKIMERDQGATENDCNDILKDKEFNNNNGNKNIIEYLKTYGDEKNLYLIPSLRPDNTVAGNVINYDSFFKVDDSIDCDNSAMVISLVLSDVNLIWRNCELFNGLNNPITEAAKQCERWFLQQVSHQINSDKFGQNKNQRVKSPVINNANTVNKNKESKSVNSSSSFSNNAMGIGSGKGDNINFVNFDVDNSINNMNSNINNNNVTTMDIDSFIDFYSSIASLNQEVVSEFSSFIRNLNPNLLEGDDLVLDYITTNEVRSSVKFLTDFCNRKGVKITNNNSNKRPREE